jgi:hypothetical protein
MINRILSIGFPLQANAFNHTKIDPVSTIDFWKNFINVKYKTSPGWFFTSTKKKDKAKKYTPEEDVSLFIRDKYEISEREIKELSEYYPEEFQKFCNSIKEAIG